MYFIYALFSEKHDRIYVGMTSDIKRRVAEHNAGKEKSTKHYIPWILFYSKERNSRPEARGREKRLKTSFGRSYLREILSNKRL